MFKLNHTYSRAKNSSFLDHEAGEATSVLKSKHTSGLAHKKQQWLRAGTGRFPQTLKIWCMGALPAKLLR